MEQIRAIRQGSLIEIRVKKDKEETCFPARDVRGALVWPTLHSPAYYSIFAQQNEVNPQGKLPLVLLAEAEEEVPRKLFQKLAEDAGRLCCRQFYVDLKRENQDFVHLFREFARYQRLLSIDFRRAAMAGKPHIAVSLIREWARDKALEIPEGSILREQLKRMSGADLDGSLEETFYAVTALGFIVGSVEKEPWQPPGFGVAQGSRMKVSARGWT